MYDWLGSAHAVLVGWLTIINNFKFTKHYAKKFSRKLALHERNKK